MCRFLPSVPSTSGGVDGLLPKEDVSLLNFRNGFVMLKVVGSSALWVEKIDVEFCCYCTY